MVREQAPGRHKHLSGGRQRASSCSAVALRRRCLRSVRVPTLSQGEHGCNTDGDASAIIFGQPLVDFRVEGVSPHEAYQGLHQLFFGWSCPVDELACPEQRR